MSVPGWLLRVMIGYLSERKLTVRYKGQVSEKKSLNAGTGQGCLLGMWCFLFLLNFAGPRGESRKLGEIITQPLNRRKPMQRIKKKWIDDMSMMCSLDLKKSLVVDTSNNSFGPVPYYSRTGHVLPETENLLQQDLHDLQTFTINH